MTAGSGSGEVVGDFSKSGEWGTQPCWGGARRGWEGSGEKTGIDPSLAFSVGGVEKWGGGRRAFRSKGEFPLPLF